MALIGDTKNLGRGSRKKGQANHQAYKSYKRAKDKCGLNIARDIKTKTRFTLSPMLI